MPPSLPREVIDMIFDDPVLDTSDAALARCCRVSKARRDQFRPRLYRTIRVNLERMAEALVDLNPATPWRLIYDRRSRKCLATLQQHSNLRSLVQNLYLDVSEPREGDPDPQMFTTLDAALATILRCCPNANSLFLPPVAPDTSCRPMLDPVFDRPYQRVDLVTDESAAWYLLHLHQETLKEVSFSSFFEGLIPPPLTTMSYSGLRLQSLRLPNIDTDAASVVLRRVALHTLLDPSRPSLTDLELTFDPRIVPDLADFPSLRNLTFFFENEISDAATAAPAAIARSPNLRRLHIGGYRDISSAHMDVLFGSKKDAVAHHLPLTVTELDLFTNSPNEHHLRNFLQFLPTASALRRVIYDRPYHKRTEADRVIESEFAARGIALGRYVSAV
ncbi:hypothetical protein JCM6882_008261 [Rhodosporidiobolus microsporus]